MTLALGRDRGVEMKDSSILTTIKKLLGMTENYTDYDDQIIVYINSVFPTLNQLGIGTKECFNITSADETWSSFLSDDNMLENVKTYIYMKVKIMFDPPQQTNVMDALNRIIAENEWRLSVYKEHKEVTNA